MFIPGKHKSNIGDIDSESPIFLDKVHEKYWHFFQGNLKMLFVTLLFKS